MSIGSGKGRAIEVAVGQVLQIKDCRCQVSGMHHTSGGGVFASGSGKAVKAQGNSEVFRQPARMRLMMAGGMKQPMEQEQDGGRHYHSIVRGYCCNKVAFRSALSKAKTSLVLEEFRNSGSTLTSSCSQCCTLASGSRSTYLALDYHYPRRPPHGLSPR